MKTILTTVNNLVSTRIIVYVGFLNTNDDEVLRFGACLTNNYLFGHSKFKAFQDYFVKLKDFKALNRACKSRARKRGWGQLGAEGPYSPC